MLTKVAKWPERIGGETQLLCINDMYIIFTIFFPAGVALIEPFSHRQNIELSRLETKEQVASQR